MKLSKFDIGAEIIAILTKGMYQDPRDALREYIQNAVDANSENINVKIRQNSIIVEDDGIGMDYKILRKAIRIGVSDKKPGKDVGFMGIGIYSAYHLCDKLVIYSRAESSLPNKLEMDFKSMKEVLSAQKELRLKDELTGDELIDLQTLLEKYIVLSDENSLKDEEYPKIGTRVELIGVEEHFYKELTNFDFVADYLKDVVPLHFNYKKFKWGEEIENKITEICEQYNAKFELVNVKLQVNNKIEDLYKPYQNSDFHNDESQKPIFKELKTNDNFIGVVWGCLNSTRNKIRDKNLRGFLIRKQGFAIGRRENVVKYFNSHTHFDRYIGEIIVVNPNLLPNASRDDFEFTKLRSQFYDLLAQVGSEYNQLSNDFQNETKAKERISEITKRVKIINGNFSGYEKDVEKLVDFLIELKSFNNELESIKNRKVLKDEKELLVLRDSLSDITQSIQITINNLVEEKKGKKKSSKTNKIQVAKKLKEIKTEKEIKTYESLLDVLKDLDFEFEESVNKIFFIIDELYIQRLAENKKMYYELLDELKREIINIEE